MYINFKERLVKDVGFERSEMKYFEYDGIEYYDIHELLNSFQDHELSVSVVETLLAYFKSKSIELESLDDVLSFDGYEVQWAFDYVSKKTGLDIAYYGGVLVKEFVGVSELPLELSNERYSSLEVSS